MVVWQMRIQLQILCIGIILVISSLYVYEGNCVCELFSHSTCVPFHCIYIYCHQHVNITLLPKPPNQCVSCLLCPWIAITEHSFHTYWRVFHVQACIHKHCIHICCTCIIFQRISTYFCSHVHCHMPIFICVYMYIPYSCSHIIYCHISVCIYIGLFILTFALPYSHLQLHNNIPI